MKELITKKKSIPYAVKGEGAMQVMDVDLNKRIVTGYYSTFNFFDSDCDVLIKGCANRSIAERGPASDNPQKIKHLMHHNWTQLPGKVQLLEERKDKGITGIYFETKMSSSQLGTDTLINYQEQVYDNHSIGFQYLDGEYIDNESESWRKCLDRLINPEDAEKAGFMFLWKEIRLWEGSTVAFGANALTPYLGVKSNNKEALQVKINDRIDLLVKQVRSGTQSDDMLQQLEMELLQIKQIQTELYSLEPSVKDTLQKQARPNDEKKAGVFDISKALKNTQIIQ